MKIVRYQKNDEICYGILKDGKIRSIEGDIFDKFNLGLQQVKKETVKLLAPIVPPDIIAIGLNYKKHNESNW